MTDRHTHPLPEHAVAGPLIAGDGLRLPNATQVLPDLNRRYGAALDRHSRGERIRFELFMFPLPTQETDGNGTQQLLAMVGLYVEVPGVVLNTHVSGTRIMQANGHTDEIVDVHARETIEQLLIARSQQLEQATKDAQAAAERGEQPPATGFIRPNGKANPTFDDMERAVNGYAHGE
jgi:hypothetical protein